MLDICTIFRNYGPFCVTVLCSISAIVPLRVRVCVCVYPDYGGQSSRGKWYLIRIHPISLHTAQDLSSIQYYECIISLCVCALLIRVYVFTQYLCVCHSQCA